MRGQSLFVVEASTVSDYTSSDCVTDLPIYAHLLLSDLRFLDLVSKLVDRVK